MKTLTLTTLAAFIFLSINAQITFQKTFGGGGDDYGYSVQQTSDWGYIIAGYTISFGAGADDVYLVKTDANGDAIWTRTFGGVNHDDGNSIYQTNDGGYITVGYTYSFGVGNGDVYLIKTDSNGDAIWTRTFGGALFDSGNFVRPTSDGGYIIVGTTLSFGAGDGDVYLIKTDGNGAALWTKTYGGAGNDEGRSIHQTNDGGYVIVGNTNSFGAGSIDVYLIKTDGNGDTLWTKTFGGVLSDLGSSVQQTNDGGYVIIGSTGFFPDVYLIKTDATGNLIWDRTFGETSFSFGSSVLQTNDGRYVIAGVTRSCGSCADYVYLIKTDATGNLIWDRTFGGSFGGSGGVPLVQKTVDGGYIIGASTGSFGSGAIDIYLIKTDSSGNSGCNESIPATTVDTPVTLVSSPSTIVTIPATITTTPATLVGSGGTDSTLCVNTSLPNLRTDIGSVGNILGTGAQGFSIVDIVNDGSASAGSFSVGFFASTDAVISSSDFLLGDTLIPGLTPGNDTAEAILSFDLCTIPGLSDGIYYIGYIIDYVNDVPELYEMIMIL